MLMIRFTRIGKKKQPSYRIIISEKTRDPWGRYLELLGNYNPRSKVANIKADRVKHWLAKGAQASPSVHNLLIKQGLIADTRKKKSVAISKKRREKIDAKKAANGSAELTTGEPKVEIPKEEPKAAAEAAQS